MMQEMLSCELCESEGLENDHVDDDDGFDLIQGLLFSEGTPQERIEVLERQITLEIEYFVASTQIFRVCVFFVFFHVFSA